MSQQRHEWAEANGDRIAVTPESDEYYGKVWKNGYIVNIGEARYALLREILRLASEREALARHLLDIEDGNLPGYEVHKAHVELAERILAAREQPVPAPLADAEGR